MRVTRARKAHSAPREGVQYDEAAATRKRTELTTTVRQVLSQRLAISDDATVQALVNHFVIVTPPTAGPEAAAPGHVELNLTRLFTAVKSGQLTFAGTTAPWTTLLGGLVVWEHLWLDRPLDVGEVDAMVLWTLWETRDDRDMVGKSTIVAAVNDELMRHRQSALSPGQIDHALVKLRHLKCIETARSAINSFWLRELVQFQFS
jgi:hypothetical protein